MATSSYIGATIGAAATAPAGASGSVQYNNSGSLGGFGSWDGSLLTVPGSVSANAYQANVQLAAPSNVQITQEGTPGSTEYDYLIFAADAHGHWSDAATAQTLTGAATLDGTDFNRIAWDAVSGASQYYVLDAVDFRVVAFTTSTTYDDTGQSLGGLVNPNNGSAVSDSAWVPSLVVGLYDTDNPTSSVGSAWIRGIGQSFPGLLYTSHLLIDSTDASAELMFRVNPNESDGLPFNQIKIGVESSGYFLVAGPLNDGSGMQDIFKVIPNLNFSLGGYDEVPGVQFPDAVPNLSGTLALLDGSNVLGKAQGVTWSDGALTAPMFALADGGALRGDSTDAHTYKFSLYDVNGAAYVDWATMTNGNTPSVVIAPPAGGTTISIQANTYKSSDGSTGASGSGTVISAITVKDGLVTSITVA